MSMTTRIIVIDDEKHHLESLTKELDRLETLYLPIHFTGEQVDIPACPNVRLIFADLHLVGGIVSDYKRDFTVIGSLIEDVIRPSGPYLMLLWTRYPDQASTLRAFLERLQGVAKPVDILPLPKLDHLNCNGDIKNEAALVRAIDALAKGWFRSKGVLSLQGSWDSLDDQEVDTLIKEIYTTRQSDTGRIVEFED